MPRDRSKETLCLLKRLGIRYVEPTECGAAPPPAPEAPSIPKTAASPPGRDPKAVTHASASPGRKGEVPPGVLEPRFSGKDSEKGRKLVELFRSIRDCRKCPLWRTRTNFVFGMGNPDAEVLFVGEAPGADEDAQGLPFVGRAGQLLTKIIEATKVWKREDVFIANVLKSRPPGNRTPLPDEVTACLPHLEEQIRILQPRLVVALGSTAAQALLGIKSSLGKLRGRWHEYRGVPLLVTYHPAALLRFPGYKKDVWEDMKALVAKYREIAASDSL